MATKKMTVQPSYAAQEAKWRAEEDMRTLARAKEIEADRKRMMAAQKIAAEKIKEMQKVVAKSPTRKK